MFEAFGRSREWVRDNGWRVFGVIVVIFLGVAIVGGVVDGIIGGLTDESFVGYALADLIVNMLLAPLTAIAATVIYVELRRVKGDAAGRGRRRGHARAAAAAGAGAPPATQTQAPPAEPQDAPPQPPGPAGAPALMRVLSVVHQRDAGGGRVRRAAAARAGHELVEWVPAEAPPPALGEFDAAFVFGSAAQVDEEDRHAWLRPDKELVAELLERGTPLLGVCFGSQLVADASGAVVRRAAAPEIGWTEIELTPQGVADPVLGFLPERFTGFGWHYYEWLLPPGAVAAGAQRGLPAGVPARGATGLGHPVPPRGQARRSRLLARHLGRTTPCALATGLDPEAIRTESAERIGAWNEVGRTISQRFLAAAAELSPAVSGTRR